MPTVYVRSTDHRAKFHRLPECSQFKGAEPLEVDLNDLRFPVPCMTCYRDAPRAVSHHRWCHICKPKIITPCPHNGAVPITIPRTRRSEKTIMTAPGDTYTQVVWIWPERARHHVRTSV